MPDLNPGSFDECSYDTAPPKASAMIESMRAFGYDLRTALADLIDNSISAKARHIHLKLEWNGSQSRILLADDGIGMSDGELLDAMKLGNKSPMEERDPKDLGRFGLGLKTASFSQCRRVTVHSKTPDSDVAVRTWDLDYVSECGEWRLLKDQEFADPDCVASLNKQGAGTIVLWEKLDRVVGECSPDNERAHRHFLEKATNVKRHLGMVFHLYLTGRNALSIEINEREVVPWDPFLVNEPATELLSPEHLHLNGHEIVIQPYVLPHHSRISKEVHTSASGPAGWNAQQGFYVYRNRRLLVAGHWLGLGYKKEEHYKLARISVEIPNALDSEWQLDIRKSRAYPPRVLRDDLKRIAKVTREHASRVYRHRGKVIQRDYSAEYVFPWNKHVRENKVSYRVNQEHPLVSDALECKSISRKTLKAILTLLEQTVPVPLIVMNSAEAPDSHALPFEGAATAEVNEVVIAVYDALRKQGLRHEAAINRLSCMEPFDSYPEVVAVLPDKL